MYGDNQIGRICYPQLASLFRPKCIGLIHFPLRRIFINFQVCLLQSGSLHGSEHRIYPQVDKHVRAFVICIHLELAFCEGIVT